MSTAFINGVPGALNASEIDEMASRVLEKIECSHTPRVVIWDQVHRRLRTTSIETSAAQRILKKCTCLGTYDYKTRLQDIVDDFNAIYFRDRIATDNRK